jgi:hypothetical protein
MVPYETVPGVPDEGSSRTGSRVGAQQQSRARRSRPNQSSAGQPGKCQPKGTSNLA